MEIEQIKTQIHNTNANNQKTEISINKIEEKEIKNDNEQKSNDNLNPYVEQMTQIDQEFILNIKQLNFFQILGNYEKVKIICNKKKCEPLCHSTRSYQVLGINENNEENQIMTASQEKLFCNSLGYMLVYKVNDVIFGTLGYQKNTNCSCGCGDLCNCSDAKFDCGGCGFGDGKCNCLGCICGCSEGKCDCNVCSDGDCLGNCCKRCCTNFFDNCCKPKETNSSCCCCICELCQMLCSNNNNCCKNGGCFLGGCFAEGGCCCLCEDECCVGGCCLCCDCCCFKGGLCHEPFCKKGFCSCPNCENILLDVRFLNTIEEALNINGGVYVGTLYEPFNCFGLFPTNIGYKKCGERFAIENKCCSFTNLDLGIIDLKKEEKVGNIKQIKQFCGDVENYEVDFPKDDFPLEKLLIISEIFMFVFLKWDEGGNNTMIITKKRKTFPGFQIE